MHGIVLKDDVKVKRSIYDQDSNVGRIATNIRAKFPVLSKEKLLQKKNRDVLGSNLKSLYNLHRPDICIVEAFTALEGNGPWHGSKVDCRTVFISRNVVATDIVVMKYVGLPIKLLGYIDSGLECEKFEVHKFGDKYAFHTFKPHYYYNGE